MSIPQDAGEVLLPLARDAVERVVGLPGSDLPDLPAWLGEPGAAFVTLTLDGRLRGCIGSLQAHRSLGADVVENAARAAVADPRFEPVTPEEARRLRVEVSVLSEPEPFPVADEDDAAARLRPGVDGVVLTALGRRATYLPQVWEQIPDPHQFLRSLKQKAGVPADHWGPDVRLERYGVTKVEEPAR